MSTRYKITGIGSRDSHYGKSWLIGKVGRFVFDTGSYKPPQWFSFGTFFPDDGSPQNVYFCEVQLEPVKEKELEKSIKEKRYTIIEIGENDAYYDRATKYLGKPGTFKPKESLSLYSSPGMPGFVSGMFHFDDNHTPMLFRAIKIKEIKEKEMIIDIDGVKFQGSVADVYSILDKLGLTHKLATYTSSTHGEIPICTMDTRHIRNALLKMWRESTEPGAIKARNTVSSFLTDDLDEYLKEYTNLELARALRCIQPMIMNTEFHYLLKELETREDED